MQDAAPTPPRYVPTLTEVVSPDGSVTPLPLPVTPRPEPPSEPQSAGQELAQQMPTPALEADIGIENEERLLRILQRVEVLLDQRLAGVVARAAESVTREFALRLRQDMAPLIKEAVNEAVAEELNPGLHSDRDPPN